MALSLGVEVYEFNKARLNLDGLGMLDATVDAAAMLPAIYGGALGITFSLGYALSDNIIAPAIVPAIVDGACFTTGNC